MSRRYLVRSPSREMGLRREVANIRRGDSDRELPRGRLRSLLGRSLLPLYVQDLDLEKERPASQRVVEV